MVITSHHNFYCHEGYSMGVYMGGGPANLPYYYGLFIVYQLCPEHMLEGPQSPNKDTENLRHKQDFPVSVST